MGYDSINQAVLHQVPPSARSILDVGCGAGSMGSALKASRPCSVAGITFDTEEAVGARTRLDRVEVADLNVYHPAALGRFDCILCCHVLEHLVAPERLLFRLHDCLEADGCLIVALPNVLVWRQRWQFVRGRFRYTDGGLMDRTHFRFYDWNTAAELLTQAGYAIHQRIGDGGFPLSRLLPTRLRGPLDRLAARYFPGLFAWQFVFVCQAVPHARPEPISSDHPRLPAAQGDGGARD